MTNSGPGPIPVEPNQSDSPPIDPAARRLEKQRNIYQDAYVRHGGGAWCGECGMENCGKAQFQRHVLHDLEHGNGLFSQHVESCPCTVSGQAEAVA